MAEPEELVVLLVQFLHQHHLRRVELILQLLQLLRQRHLLRVALKFKI